jgi:hypothetical protein
MVVQRPNFLACGVILFFFLSVVNSAAATQKHATKKQAVPETTVEVVPPPPPPPPLRPEQMPAVAPQVTFQNGKLTIIARNSTLGDILRAVHTKTGANVELSGSASERVVGMFGPGPSREVMASLLDGSHFNYVMLGSEANPDQLQHLILTPKGIGGGGNDGGVPAPPPQPVAQNQPDAQPDADPNAGSDDFADDSADADATAVDQSGDDPNAQGAQIGQPNAKTPEQMLLELQRQQQIQQQQQQQQQQGGAVAPPPGFPPAPPGTQPTPPH